MLSSEEQRESFISRLQLTTAKNGEYLIMPNAAKPAFLLPTLNKEVYVKALALIKPISGKGELKKRILSYVPPKWLKSGFQTLDLNNQNSSERFSIILPWSQKICDKLTYITFDLAMKDITVHKYAFTPETRAMVRNEMKFLENLKNHKAKGIHIPELKGFEDEQEYTCLQQSFVNGMHMKELTPKVSAFFSALASESIFPLSDHPYIQNRFPLIEETLTEFSQLELLDELKSHYHKFQQEKFRVATMHSDFSSSNTVQTMSNECVIIDWEDACDDGVCIDTEYFKFRKTLQQSSQWSIKTAEQFLAVFHYVFFMAKKKNAEALDSFQLKNGMFSLR